MPPAKRTRTSAKSSKPSKSQSQLQSQLQRSPTPSQPESFVQEKDETETNPQQHENGPSAATPPSSSPPPDIDTIEPTNPSISPSIPSEAEAEDEEEEEYLDEDYDAPTNKPKPTPRTHAGGGGYNALKTFNNQYYTGMTIGSSHTWTYQPGVWHETKTEPDLWDIDYRATKTRGAPGGRKRKAPEGSGAPVGTEYHWFIVAHQFVKKIDANTYETRMRGRKYKLAHRGVKKEGGAGKEGKVGSWSVPTVRGQREREVGFLEDARRRVEGLPPVLAGEKVKGEERERGQRKVEDFFGGKKVGEGVKRKREEEGDGGRVGEGVVGEEG